jgi:predicted ATPase
MERSAHVEAMAYLTRGLELLATLPATPMRTHQELVLQTTLGPALMAIKGFAATEVEHAYTRAWELCQQVGETPELFPVVLGLRRWYFVRAEMAKARQLGAQLLALAERTQDAAQLLEAHRAVGTTLFFLGELAPALAHLERGIALYEAQRHHAHALRYGLDAGVTCLAHAAHVLWALGYLDQARHRNDEGIAQMHRGLTAWRATGAELGRSYFLALLAEAYGQLGQAEEGLRVVNEAMVIAYNHGERFYEAEICRLTGDLLLRQAAGATRKPMPTAEAEAWLRQALDIARQ